MVLYENKPTFRIIFDASKDKNPFILKGEKKMFEEVPSQNYRLRKYVEQQKNQLRK